MKKSTLYLKACTNILIYVIALILLITIVPRLIIFFLPFVIGWIVSLIANGPVKFMERKIRFKRKAGSAVMIVLILALIILLGYGAIAFLADQTTGFVENFINKWPEWDQELANFGIKINRLAGPISGNKVLPIESLGKTLEDYVSHVVSSLGTPSVNFLSSLAKSLPTVIISVIMTLLSAYFFTVERNGLVDGYYDKLPENLKKNLNSARRVLTDVVGGYLKAQLKIELWVYLVTVIGLYIIRVDYALVVALLIALLDILPFFGAGLIMVPWSIFLFVQGNIFAAVGMLITWGAGQLLRQIIQPKIVGDSVGLSPIPTLFLLYIGYMFGSFIGMIIAIPIGMISIALYKEGVFTSLEQSVKIVWNGIAEFRRLPKDKEGE